MTATSGSIESVSMRGRLFPVASDASAKRKLGGFENELQANGDSTVRIVKTRVPWSLADLQVEIDDARADQEFLQEISDGKDFVAMTITLCSGFTYEGAGQIVGEVIYDTQNGTATLSLGGPGQMNQQ